MTDIEPWLDGDAPPDLAESLRAARAEAPRRVVLERCITAVGAAGAVGLSASLASAASYGAGGKAVGLAALAKWGLSGAVAGTLLMTGVEIAERVAAPRPESLPRAPGVVMSHAPISKPAPAVPASPPASSVEPPAMRKPAPKTATTPSLDERLAAELSLLNDVRAAVDRRDTEAALRLLTEHDRRYPTDAQLRPEARYLRLETLELAGRREEAKNVARRILELDPRGPHAARAKELLEKE
jgi:hypothetical protein